MFRPLLLRALACSALAAPASLSGQAGPARVPAGCTYETCALRVEPGGFLSGPKLLRGRAGEQVSRLGMFGGGVETLLAGPDSAAEYARSYVSKIRTSSVIGLLGGIAYIAASVRSNGFRDTDDTDVAIALTVAGLTIVSLPFATRAWRDMSRSIWFYNAATANRP